MAIQRKRPNYEKNALFQALPGWKLEGEVTIPEFFGSLFNQIFLSYVQNIVYDGRQTTKWVKFPKFGVGGFGVKVIQAMPELKRFFNFSLDIFLL